MHELQFVCAQLRAFSVVGSFKSQLPFWKQSKGVADVVTHAQHVVQVGLVHAMSSGQQFALVQAMHGVSLALGGHEGGGEPHVPLEHMAPQHSSSSVHAEPFGWHAAQEPWKQMLEQHSLARVQPLPSCLQVPQVPS